MRAFVPGLLRQPSAPKGEAMESEASTTPGTAPVDDPGIAGLESVFADLEKRLDQLVESRLDAVEATRGRYLLFVSP